MTQPFETSLWELPGQLVQLPGQLWGSFGPRIQEIKNRVDEDKISMQLYAPSYYREFSPQNEFEKWATVEVEDFENIPDEMNSFTLRGGLYAVFDYKGPSADPSIFQYIFWDWLGNMEVLNRVKLFQINQSETSKENLSD